MDNSAIAQKLADYAAYLEGEDGNLYRIRAYRRAADSIRTLDRPIKEIFAIEGRAGLEALEGVGTHLSYTLESLLTTGEFRTMRPDGGHIDPQRLLTSLPGIGPHLGRQLHERLGITTLEEMERAAHDGRLEAIGIGPKRLRGLVDALAGRLGRYGSAGPRNGEPAVAMLLAVDSAYRENAGLNLLPTVSPRRFNPENEPWLPVYQANRAGWRCRAIFSNTALAHRLGQTHDWVVINFEDGMSSGQRTIVTETRGALRGRRVVRGRERECRMHYQSQSGGAVTPRAS
jgi:DNA polymerase (family 10)